MDPYTTAKPLPVSVSQSVRVLYALEDPKMRNFMLNDLALRSNRCADVGLLDTESKAAIWPVCSDALTIAHIASIASDFSAGYILMKRAVELNHVNCVFWFLQNTVISKYITDDQTSEYAIELLTIACEKGYTNMVRGLLGDPRFKPYVIRPSDIGNYGLKSHISPLSIACEKGYVEIIRLLLEVWDNKADPTYSMYSNTLKRYAFERAISAEKLNVLKVLTEFFNFSCTTVRKDVMRGIRLKFILQLMRETDILSILEQNPHHSSASEYFDDLLIKFVEIGSFEGVNFLLSQPEQYKQKNHGLMDALIESANSDNADIATRLLQFVDPFESRDNGHSDYNPHYGDCEYNEYYVFKQLVQRRCDPDIIMRIFEHNQENQLNYQKRDVMFILLKYDRMHELIIDKYIVKDDIRV